jgi:hypothetical protein
MFEELKILEAAREQERKTRDALEYKKDKYKRERDEAARLREDFEKEAKKEVKKNRELLAKLATASKTTQKLSEDAERLKSIAEAKAREADEGRRALAKGRSEYVQCTSADVLARGVRAADSSLARTRFARAGTRS